MSTAAVDGVFLQEPPTANALTNSLADFPLSPDMPVEVPYAPNERTSASRRTPRKSLIVVLPENHVLASDAVSNNILSGNGPEEVDVIVACAGPPRNLGPLRRRVRDLRVLLAPPGTHAEELRELAIARAEGDIVTLLSGILAECVDT